MRRRAAKKKVNLSQILLLFVTLYRIINFALFYEIGLIIVTKSPYFAFLMKHMGMLSLFLL